MDFGLSAETRELQARTRRFIDEVVIPAEKLMPHHEATAEWDALRRDLQGQAREAGVFLPQMEHEWGGLGLNWCDTSVILEEAGRSVLGIQALNCAAPDEGNMHMLEKIATPAQKERYLKPLTAGKVRSCYAMTEPAPGTGADPSLLLTSAVKKGNRWVINGRKWFISGAEGAAFSIVMAKTDEVRGRHGATMFLVDADNPGYKVTRRLPINDLSFVGGHGVIDFTDCEVGEDAILGAVNEGFDYAQVRLRPARLTHCMRWLGAARRGIEIALDYASKRQAFGTTLSQHQAVQWMLADSEIEIQAARLLIWQAAWLLDRGQRASRETSIAKVFVAETVNKVADRAMQVCGAQSVLEETPLANLYRETRHFRIYDGPSEVHRMSIAKRMFRQQGQGGWRPNYD
jgi:acyl-CoA dehydrogenase